MNISTLLEDVISIPVKMIGAILAIATSPIFLIERVVSSVAYAAGVLAWHGGEALVNPGASVVSELQQRRDTLFTSLGFTLLAGAALTTPVLAMQLLALPILLGTFIGTVNNYFTNRTCPEFLATAEAYKGTSLEHHIIKTTSPWIKPFITGCSAHLSVGKVTGLGLALAGAALLSIPPAAAALTIVAAVTLIATNIFAAFKQYAMQRNIDEYARIIDVELTDEELDKSWNTFKQDHDTAIQQHQYEVDARDTGISDHKPIAAQILGK